MVRVSVRAAAALSAVVLMAMPAPVRGESVPPDGGARYLLFATTDLWRYGGSAHGGVVWSPEGAERDGFVLKLIFGGGTYRYTSGALGNTTVTADYFAGSLMPGWRIKRGELTLTAFAGVDVQNHSLSPDDPSAGLRGGYLGLRTTVEVWYQPNPAWMVAADASLSTIGPSYSARLAAGTRLLDRFYVGPEVAAFGFNGNYRQTRFGMHITALKFEPLEWSAGVGIAVDSDNRDSLYARLGVLARH